jgi:predicted O-methyltransferase YrrM
MENSEYFKNFFTYDLEILEKMDILNKDRIDMQPSVEPVIGRFLSFFIRAFKARAVLELGTSVGYSGMWMAGALKESGGRLYTIDNHERTPAEAKANFEEAGLCDVIVQIIGDIEVEVEKFDRKFDIIFQDGGKYLYPVMLDKLYDLLEDGGVLISDDTMFPCVEGVRDNLKKHVDSFNRKLKDDDRFYSVALPIGHGLTLSFKK